RRGRRDRGDPGPALPPGPAHRGRAPVAAGGVPLRDAAPRPRLRGAGGDLGTRGDRRPRLAGGGGAGRQGARLRRDPPHGVAQPGPVAGQGRGQVRARRPPGLRMVAGPGAGAGPRGPMPGALLPGPRRPRRRCPRPLDPGRRPRRAPPGAAPQVPLARRGTGGMTDPRPLAVVCVSGGMDSAVTAALASADHRLAFLHGNYGQRTEARELSCFERLSDHYAAVSRLVVDFTSLASIGGSSLTDPRLPVREGPPVAGVVPTSYVPFRNA